nr:YeeE/YedE thiosulfate transporter family protein [Clostridium tetani]
MFINQYTILNLGVLIGSLIATLLVSQFKWKRIKSKKQFIMALIGGVMMGYGTRLAVGCNIGAFFSGIPSFSLHAWIFGVFAMLGTWVGVKILTKYFI